ncbi:MAG: 50S ribosomal protein L24e [Candidatus Nanohaloarchaea archaeon]
MECDYCGDAIGKTEGKMLVRQSGEKLHFCSGKCEKNYENDRGHRYTDKQE